MKRRYIYFGLLALTATLIILWESSITGYLRLHLGLRYKLPSMVIKAADQLLQSNGDNMAIFREALNAKISIAEGQANQVYMQVNEAIAKNPNDPTLLIIRARSYIVSGHPNKAIIDYEAAENIILSGHAKSDSFYPSDDLINQWIELLPKSWTGG